MSVYVLEVPVLSRLACCYLAPRQLWGSTVPTLCLSDRLVLLGLLREEGELSSPVIWGKGSWTWEGESSVAEGISLPWGFFLGSGL